MLQTNTLFLSDTSLSSYEHKDVPDPIKIFGLVRKCMSEKNIHYVDEQIHHPFKLQEEAYRERYWGKHVGKAVGYIFTTWLNINADTHS
jgi:hypothetical protein